MCVHSISISCTNILNMRMKFTSISIKISLSIDIYSTKLLVCKISYYTYIKTNFGQ